MRLYKCYYIRPSHSRQIALRINLERAADGVVKRPLLDRTVPLVGGVLVLVLVVALVLVLRLGGDGRRLVGDSGDVNVRHRDELNDWHVGTLQNSGYHADDGVGEDGACDWGDWGGWGSWGGWDGLANGSGIVGGFRHVLRQW